MSRFPQWPRSGSTSPIISTHSQGMWYPWRSPSEADQSPGKKRAGLRTSRTTGADGVSTLVERSLSPPRVHQQYPLASHDISSTSGAQPLGARGRVIPSRQNVRVHIPTTLHAFFDRARPTCARALHTSVSARHPSPTGSPPHEAYPSLMKGYGTEQTRGSKLVNVSSAHRRRVAIARLSVSPGVHPLPCGESVADKTMQSLTSRSHQELSTRETDEYEGSCSR